MVTQVLKALRTIAEIEGNKSQDRKIGAIQKLLRDCKGPEARFLIRACQGKLRIGLAETTVLIALAHAVVRSPPSTALKKYEDDIAKAKAAKASSGATGGDGGGDGGGGAAATTTTTPPLRRKCWGGARGRCLWTPS